MRAPDTGLNLHDDPSMPARVMGDSPAWQASPAEGVDRRYLERHGGEAARATSIVRYAPGSRFARHAHPLGEEFLVLQGTFSDEHGHYPAGTYVRNPPGSSHAPFSESGCVIFVKLRHMAATESQRLVRRPEDLAWKADATGCHSARLHTASCVEVSLERWDAGARPRLCSEARPLEVLIARGTLRALGKEQDVLPAWTWMRSPRPDPSWCVASEGALLWVARGLR